MFDYTLETVPEMQSEDTWISLKLWSIYSTVGIIVALVLPFVVTFIMFKKRPLSFFYPCAFYYVLMLGSIFFLMGITKVTYHQARPFWVSKEIEAVQCSTEFGNPSGHSMFSLGSTLTVWLDLNQYVSQNESVLRAWYVRVILLLGAILFGITIGYSRVILGVHSWNQVLFGWSLGVWLAFTLHFCVKDRIVENAWNLLHGEETRFASMVMRCLALMFFTFAV